MIPKKRVFVKQFTLFVTAGKLEQIINFEFDEHLLAVSCFNFVLVKTMHQHYASL